MTQPVVCLTDCTDTNAVARLGTRISALLGQHPLILPLGGARPDLTAGLTLVDIIASTEMTGTRQAGAITLINIAPRDHKSVNGAPFCFFKSGEHLVVTTLNPAVLAFARRHLGVSELRVTDVRQVMDAAATSWASFSTFEVQAIVTSQFRSLWFMPLLAKWIREDRSFPTQALAVHDSLPEPIVAVVDNFGNCKTSCTATEIGFAAGSHVMIRTPTGVRAVRCFSRLADVPRGEPGLVVGSSGRGLLELVVNGASAAADFQLAVGDTIFGTGPSGEAGARHAHTTIPVRI